MNIQGDTQSYTAVTAPPGEPPTEPAAGVSVPEPGEPAAPDRPERRRRRWVTLSIAGFCVVALGWAALVRVDDTVQGPGAVVPAGRIRAVQHLEGGMIKEIKVKEGQLVEKGEVLMRLDPAPVQARLTQLEIEEASLALKVERLRAIADGREPDFSFATPKFKELVQDQWAIYNGFIRSQENRRAILESRIAQREADLRKLQDEEEALTRKAQILIEELTAREEMYKRGISPKILYLNIKKQVGDVRGELAGLVSDRERLNEDAEQARIELEKLDSDAQEEALDQLGPAVTGLAQAKAERQRLEARVAAFDIRAPVRGFVKGVDRHTVGTLIPAGAQVLEVVPVDEQLVAEARIRPGDVARLSVGQPVSVQIIGLPGGRQGTVAGELKDVSAATFAGPGGPYYRVGVVLDQDRAGTGPDAAKIIPGMEVVVHIRTGRRTFLEFLLSPMTRAARTF